MITYYRTAEHDGRDDIEKILHAIPVEFESVRIQDAKEKHKHFSSNIALPILKVDHMVYEGPAAIYEFLKEFSSGEIDIQQKKTFVRG